MKVMESDEEDEDDQDMESTDLTKKSTASDNKTFLASKLTFKVDAEGQEAFVDEEGNGVMMGWEKEISTSISFHLSGGRRLTTKQWRKRAGCCASHEADKRMETISTLLM